MKIKYDELFLKDFGQIAISILIKLQPENFCGIFLLAFVATFLFELYANKKLSELQTRAILVYALMVALMNVICVMFIPDTTIASIVSIMLKQLINTVYWSILSKLAKE